MRMQSGPVRRRRVLVIDPDAVYRAGLEELLGTLFWTVLACADRASALQAFDDGRFDAVWMEFDLRDPTAHVDELLLRARAVAPTAALMVVTSTKNVDRAKLAAAPVGAQVFGKRDTQAAAQRLTELEDARIAREGAAASAASRSR